MAQGFFKNSRSFLDCSLKACQADQGSFRVPRLGPKLEQPLSIGASASDCAGSKLLGLRVRVESGFF